MYRRLGHRRWCDRRRRRPRLVKCIGFREPVLACAGCHGSLLAFVGSSLAGKYMKILIS
jgi:hypothetical protein